jgi:hypothetical protein
MTTSKSVKQQNSQTELQQTRQEVAAASAPQLVPATSINALERDHALERHLSEWGGGGGRMFAFNGQTGIFRTTDDDVEIKTGTRFIAFLHETRKGFIRFNGAGMAPDVKMVRIDEDADIEREDLGDLDKSKWPLNMSGTEQEDPWKPQMAIPMALYDSGSELYIYIARGVVQMNAAGDLLGRWRWHPKRQLGLVPVIKIESGTYPSRKYGGRKPKPMLVIDGWVTRSGEQPTPVQAIAPSLAEELNDKIDY